MSSFDLNPTPFLDLICHRTTFQTTFLVTTTDSRGDATTSAPSIVTSIVVSTASDGLVVTVTEVGANHQQTLSPDNNNSNKSS